MLAELFGQIRQWSLLEGMILGLYKNQNLLANQTQRLVTITKKL